MVKFYFTPFFWRFRRHQKTLNVKLLYMFFIKNTHYLNILLHKNKWYMLGIHVVFLYYKIIKYIIIIW